MRSALFALLLLFAPASWAQEALPIATEESAVAPQGLRILNAADVDPAEFLWERRIVVVMANSPQDPAFVQQMRDIEAMPEDLDQRDVVVLVDSDRNSDSVLRRLLRPRGFMLAIIDKDGEIKQRRPAPRSVREIVAIIDRLPLRRQEVLDSNPGR